MTTGKTIALTRRTFVGKVMPLLLNMLSRLVITFLPRSKCLLISWLQSPSAVILELPKIKSKTVSLSAINVVSSAYLRLLIFLLAMLIPDCFWNFSCSTLYKLNKQADNIQPWHIPFRIWNQSVVLCPVLTVASWPAYRFLKRQVRCSGIPVSFRIFHTFLWSTQSKAFA